MQQPCNLLLLSIVAPPLQAAAERLLREQGQLASAASAASAGAEAAAEAPAADAPAEPAAAAGDVPADGDAAAAPGGGQGGKKGKAVSAKDKEGALLKAKRKEIMERAGGQQLAMKRYYQPLSVVICMLCSCPITQSLLRVARALLQLVCACGSSRPTPTCSLHTLAVLAAAGITDKATVADVEAELADLEEVEPSWELPAELQEYR